ncbi:MAG: C25 family cysteine peptidase [Muribaculaceae bacterium]|nr:C25 family cysteine peptidase [Muribaculaceae bacterium]
MYSNLKVTLLTLLTAALFFCERATAEVSFASSSVLSDGRWVKIRIDQSGIYRISHSTLRTWGFSNPEAVSIAGYGSVERTHSLDTAPDDLPAIPVSYGSDAIYFYGEGASRVQPAASGGDIVEHRNSYSASSYYFITDNARSVSSPQIESNPVAATGSAEPIGTHTVIDRRRYTDYHPYGTGAMFFSPNLADFPRSVTESWSIAGEATDARFTYEYIGLATSDAGASPEVSISGALTPDPFLAPMLPSSSGNLLYQSSPVQTIALTQVDPTVSITVSAPSNGFSMLALDHITLSYNTPNASDAAPALWDFAGVSESSQITFTSPSSDLEIWDVTTPTQPVALEQGTLPDGRTAVSPAHSGNVKLAVFSKSGSGVPEPVLEGTVSNQNLHSLRGVDMLIVASDIAYDEALRLAQAHKQYQDLDVAVVRQTEIFNEFSSGAYHPNALRRLAMMLQGRGLRHLLLMGTGQSLPLKPGEQLAENVVTTFHTEYPEEDRYDSRNHCSDQYFGILDDRIGTRLAQIGMSVSLNVGRAPVKNPDEAHAFVNKCIRYLADPREAGRTGEIFVFSGFGDENAHLESALKQASIVERLMPGATVHVGCHSRFPSVEGSSTSELQLKFIKARLGGQPRLVNYSGHATEAILDMDYTLTEALDTRFGSAPIFVMAGCRTGWFDRPTPSMGANFAVAEHGPIVALATARNVYMTNNHVLNNFFTEYLFGAAPSSTIGDVFTKALNNSQQSSNASAAIDQMLNNMLFQFLGDPALPVHAPSGQVIASLEEKIDAPALTPITISGTVTDGNGRTDTSFNGSVELTLYAPSHEIRTQSPDPSDTTNGDVVLTVDDDEILSASAAVKSGKWTAVITPPLIERTGVCRLAMNAVSTDRRTAFGATKALNITDPQEATPASTDTQAPEISIMLDNPETTAAAVTGTRPVLQVSISDTVSGVRINRSNIGAMPVVRIDGHSLGSAVNTLRSDGDGTYTLTLPLGPLAAGTHTISVSATDNASNTSHTHMEFIVTDTPFTASLEASATLVRDGIDFSLSHTAAATPTATLLILDSTGHTVHTARNATFPYHWNLTLPDGTPAPDGTYRASVMLSSQGTHSSTPSTQFTVVH